MQKEEEEESSETQAERSHESRRGMKVSQRAKLRVLPMAVLLFSNSVKGFLVCPGHCNVRH